MSITKIELYAPETIAPGNAFPSRRLHARILPSDFQRRGVPAAARKSRAHFRHSNSLLVDLI